MTRLHLSDEAENLVLQIDPSVLEALPPDIREQVEQTFALQHKLPVSEGKKENGCNTIGLQEQPVATVLLQIPPLSDQESGINVIALPAFSQVRL